MRIAVYQCPPGTADVAGNLARLERAARQAADAGADVLVCPELMLTGYAIGRERLHALAEPADGPSAERIAAVAAGADIAVAYGYPEREGGAVYNAAQLLGRDGARVLNYRKTHLFGSDEASAFTPGAVPDAVADLGSWRVGLLICYDVEFPEAVRLLALAGVDLVLVPTALMQPYDRVPHVLIPARAWESGAFVAYANYCGAEGELVYCGGSVVAAPDGAILADAGASEALVTATLARDALADARRLNTYLADRRPALYRALAEDDP